MDQSNIVYMAACVLADIDIFTEKYTEKVELEESTLNL
jgi:hypothetical protein